MYSEMGYVLHKGCVPPDRIEALVHELDAVVWEKAGDRDALERSPLLREMSRDAFGLAGQIFTDRTPTLLRCILFDKTPNTNWSLTWHQDLNIKSKDGSRLDWNDLPRVVTFRLHLDPTPSENGALRVLPGSHLGGVLSDAERRELDMTVATIEAEPGDVLQMSPLLVHSSLASRQPRRRRIVHVDYLGAC